LQAEDCQRLITGSTLAIYPLFDLVMTISRPLATIVLLLVCQIVLSGVSVAQTITTAAGTGKPENNGDSGQGTAVNIGDPFGVEIGPDAALYITEVRNHRVLRLDPKMNALTTVAGNGEMGYAGDGGPATKAKLNEPYEVRFDRAGNILFVEMKNHLIRRVDAKTGVISTVGGTGKAGFGGDGGPAVEAQFNMPHSIALDSEDNLYVADIGNHRIRKIDARTGIVHSIAGNGEKKLPVDGALAKDKPMLGPRALFITGDTLWIALREGHSVWKMSLAEGRLQHFAGTGKRGYSGDGHPAKEATFDGPKGIAVGADGTVFIADTENHAIRRIDGKSGIITTLAGMGPMHKGSGGDGGQANKAQMDRPHGVCVAPDGTVYVGDTLNHKVRKITAK
jgi:streptogramin lyase